MNVSKAARLPLTQLMLLAMTLSFSTAAAAQERPDGWLDRADSPDADMSEVEFVTMDPGWHFTSGPAAIYYNPANSASGEFTVQSEIFLFDPNGRREAFGVFLGGDNLQEASQEYVYFLIRPTGEFILKKREGTEAPTLIGWTAHEAIVPWSAKAADDATVKNVLAITATEETVSFQVNGVEVASLPRADVDVDGVVGLRVNHGVNIHVSSLDIARGGGH